MDLPLVYLPYGANLKSYLYMYLYCHSIEQKTSHIDIIGFFHNEYSGMHIYATDNV